MFVCASSAAIHAILRGIQTERTERDNKLDACGCNVRSGWLHVIQSRVCVCVVFGAAIRAASQRNIASQSWSISGAIVRQLGASSISLCSRFSPAMFLRRPQGLWNSNISHVISSKLPRKLLCQKYICASRSSADCLPVRKIAHVWECQSCILHIL